MIDRAVLREFPCTKLQEGVCLVCCKARLENIFRLEFLGSPNHDNGDKSNSSSWSNTC